MGGANETWFFSRDFREKEGTSGAKNGTRKKEGGNAERKIRFSVDTATMATHFAFPSFAVVGPRIDRGSRGSFSVQS